MIKIFFLLIVLNFKLFANISQSQLDEYLKVSRGGEVFDFYQKRLSLLVAEKFDIQNLEKDIVDISKQERFVKLYTESFMRLDKNIYNEIMQFYKTKVGKKSINIALNLTEYNKIEIENIRKECQNIFKEDCFKYMDVDKFNLLSKPKKKLLEQIAKEYDIVKIKRNLMRTSLVTMNTVYQNKYKYSDEFIEKYSTYNNPRYTEITTNITYLYFQNFTEDELVEILRYATSEAGKKEYKMIEEEIVNYTNSFLGTIVQTFDASRCMVQE